MQTFTLALANHVRNEVAAALSCAQERRVVGKSPGGDAQFDIDVIAERAVLEFVRSHGGGAFAFYSEDQSLIQFSAKPRTLLIIDPIDGTRPASAGLEMAMVSVAAAPMGSDLTIDDVEAAALVEIKSGAWLYGDASGGLTSGGYQRAIPFLSRNARLDRMFWSIEFNGHPAELISAANGRLIDASANTGGVFVFNSATFSISRIITGQLDVYADVGNRILKDHPWTEPAFRAAGKGAILHLFPYDIAAAVYLARLAGVTITDGYGQSLGSMQLTDLSGENQRSCIAAANRELHEQLIAAIDWRLSKIQPTRLADNRAGAR